MHVRNRKVDDHSGSGSESKIEDKKVGDERKIGSNKNAGCRMQNAECRLQNEEWEDDRMAKCHNGRNLEW